MNTLESIADDVAGFICDEICWACKENLKQDELEEWIWKDYAGNSTDY